MIYRLFGKRILDLLIALTSSVLLSPILVAVAILIAICDTGPIFFIQQRVGRYGNNFDFYKFRSMPIDTGNIASDKIGEVKLTWIGKFIRRTNIDELPQLLNIFKGDMSVVGPRPPIKNQSELIELRKKNGSIVCAPGLTGLAQIRSFDGMSAEEKAKFDAIYARNITFIGDLKIVFSTIVYLFKPPPVY